MKFNKTTMSLALTAAMFGSVAMTQQAFAVPDLADSKKLSEIVAAAVVVAATVDAKEAVIAAGVQATAAGNPYVSTNGLGQALIYPYYTVRDGFKTTINVFNTSDRFVAVKVRFREYQNSRDVLDFNLILSPHDKWFGVVSETDLEDPARPDQGGAVLRTTDKSCTVPKIEGSTGVFTGGPFSKLAYTSDAFKDSGDQDFSRLKSGYVEIIPMAWSVGDENNIDAANYVAKGALHSQVDDPANNLVRGQPVNCADVVKGFRKHDTWSSGDAMGAPSAFHGKPTIITDTDMYDDWEAIPPGENPLFGEYGIFNKAGGVAGGSNAVAIADWMGDNRLFTAQGFPYFLEPTLVTSAGIWDTSNLDKVDLALTSHTVGNEWSNNDVNGANVDWVLTMPTKSYHVDSGDLADSSGTLLAAADQKDNIQAGVNKYRFNSGASLTTPQLQTILAPFPKVFTAGKSEMSIDFLTRMYNSEEGGISDDGSVSFSPGNSLDSPKLRYEANVIRFGGNDVLKSGMTAANEPAALVLNPRDDIPGGDMHGFALFDVEGSKKYTSAIAMAADGTITFDIDVDVMGLPMVGFAIKQRNLTGTSLNNYGQLFGHKFSGQAGNVVVHPH